MKKILILGLLAFSWGIYAENKEELYKEELMGAIKEGNVESVTRILKAGDVQKNHLIEAALFALDKTRNECLIKVQNEAQKSGTALMAAMLGISVYIFGICYANKINFYESLALALMPSVGTLFAAAMVNILELNKITTPDPHINALEIARLVAHSAHKPEEPSENK